MVNTTRVKALFIAVTFCLFWLTPVSLVSNDTLGHVLRFIHVPSVLKIVRRAQVTSSSLVENSPHFQKLRRVSKNLLNKYLPSLGNRAEELFLVDLGGLFDDSFRRFEALENGVPAPLLFPATGGKICLTLAGLSGESRINIKFNEAYKQ